MYIIVFIILNEFGKILLDHQYSLLWLNGTLLATWLLGQWILGKFWETI